MMQKLSKSLGVARPEYLIVFSLIAILGLVTWLGDGQRFLLNFYFTDAAFSQICRLLERS